MSRLDDFLAHHIEGYLFYDIRFMTRDDEEGGGIGFPMLMTCCAGIEFLGALRSQSRFRAHGTGNEYFTEYWESCLYPAPSLRSAYHNSVYQLIRHGIAHSFFTKGNIGVVRKQPDRHFVLDATSGLVLVDAVQLGLDLISSYNMHVKPVLMDPDRTSEKATMESRLCEMESDFAIQAAKLSARFLASGMASPTSEPGLTGAITQSAGIGASGPTGPLSGPIAK